MGIAMAALGLTLAATIAPAQEFTYNKESVSRAVVPPSYSPRAGRNYPMEVYWGDTHLHTTYSPDAGLVGNVKLTPADAFQFARGDEVEAHNGMRAKLNQPLDFLVVSDHAEYLGLIPNIRKSDPKLLANEYGRRWHDLFMSGPDGAYEAALEIVGTIADSDERIKSPEIKRSVWQYITKTADQYNDPGKFTAFIGYEWTSMPDGGNNLHRVVIFKDGADQANQVLPFSAFDSENPEDLWAYLEHYEDKTGGEVLALAHNGNVSNGLMFSDKDFNGKRLTRAYAETRARWEPLYEVTQMKGDGETHPFLSPNDEFADYETWDKGNLLGNAAKEEWMLQYEYARSAYRLGLKLADRLGTNPFKFGMIGSTDAHTAFATAEEDNQWGKITLLEPRAERAEHDLIRSTVDPELSTFGWDQAASGYAAVWAEENTREAIFDAMMRRETYATTGSRMVVRFFGGWDFTADDANTRWPAGAGYGKGVPMGGDLSNAPDGATPSFLVAALKDPFSGNLDRIQIIKGWLDEDGETQERVYNVAWASENRTSGQDGKLAPVGNTVDVENATWTNTIGASELITVWTDPDFDPDQRAFYYARVIEIPTPRWTAYDAKFFGVDMPDQVPMTTQERAYTSPIWYTP
jgi:hypothetical protein